MVHPAVTAGAAPLNAVGESHGAAVAKGGAAAWYASLTAAEKEALEVVHAFIMRRKRQ